MSDRGRRASPHAPSELDRWAAERAPGLVARAEAEAVAVIRDALVAAGLGDRRAHGPAGGSDPEREASPARRPPSDAPDLLWAYCVMRDDDRICVDAPGVAGTAVQRVVSGGLAALVSRVAGAEFAQEPLTRNLNDLGWLERVARAHEAVLDATLAQGTIVPLRMCTIFEDERGVGEMLERRRASLVEALDTLDGRLEWAVKVLVDGDRLLDAARARHGDRGSDAAAGAGGAYLQRRRDERGTRDEASRLASEIAQQIHARLQDWALDARTAPAQNRELSGYEGEMVLNASYLVERERFEELRGIVAELEEHHRDLGARLELSGPWPPYNFVPAQDASALT